MALLLGIDVGTTSCKAAVFDAEGRELGVGTALCDPVRFGPDGSAEQEAAGFWRAARAAIRDALALLGPRPPVAAVGLSGAWTNVFARDGVPLDMAITWQDARATAEAAWLRQEVGQAAMDSWLAIALPISPALPVARLLWLRRHRPEMLDGAVRMAQAKDLVAWHLTGRWATDIVSGVCLVDPRTRRIAPELASLLGLPETLLPELRDPSDLIGAVSEEAAAATGLPAGVPVACGIVDSWASMLGAGLGAPGIACDVTGTSEIVGLAAPAPAADPRGLFSMRLREGTHVVYGLTVAGGDSFRWFVEAFIDPGAGAEGFALFEREAAAAPPGAEGLVFLPYLLGERSPVWDAQVRGAFAHVDRGHRRQHFARAVIEGLAHAVRHLLELAEAVGGARAEVLRVCGGGARSRLVNQVKADVLQRPVEMLTATEAGTLGAAMLAGIGLGLFRDPAEAAGRMVRPARRILPDPALGAGYDAAHRRYRALYPALREAA
jgi:xylulokinase